MLEQLANAQSWVDEANAWANVAMAFFTLLGTGVLVYVAAQVRLQRTQLHRDLENLYVERYWVIIDRFNGSKPRSRERIRAIRDYLRLSEDQCDMRELNRVTDETWKIWHRSILDQIEKEEFSEEFRRMPENELLHLRIMIEKGEEYDPSDSGRRRRKRLGL